MTEGSSKGTTGCAWGCTNPVGWVPYPKNIPRRHPLLDAVGRIDDPCARPAHPEPNYVSTPKFKAPREGYPNNMCNLEDYADSRPDEHDGGVEPLAKINLIQGCPAPVSLKIKVKPCFNTQTVMTAAPTIQQCCDDARELDTLRTEMGKVMGPLESPDPWPIKKINCKVPCGPGLNEYSCRGVIRSPREEWQKEDAKAKARCNASNVPVSQKRLYYSKPSVDQRYADDNDLCDSRPKRPEPDWFKGYGCERWGHPFYLTTSQQYGRFPPAPYSMTQAFYPMECKFTETLSVTGMPRNRSLNLTSNKTFI